MKSMIIDCFAIPSSTTHLYGCIFIFGVIRLAARDSAPLPVEWARIAAPAGGRSNEMVGIRAEPQKIGGL
jgi:hypothetical protein